MERVFFETKAVFSKDLFKPGMAVRIEGIDYEGEEMDFIGLIASNEGEYLDIKDYEGLEFDLFIEQVQGSPVYKKPRDAGEDFIGFKVTILVDPREVKIAQEDPKKKGGYKLSEDDIRNIRKLGGYNIPQSEIAGIFKIARSTVSEIINNKIHKDIK